MTHAVLTSCCHFRLPACLVRLAFSCVSWANVLCSGNFFIWKGHRGKYLKKRTSVTENYYETYVCNLENFWSGAARMLLSNDMILIWETMPFFDRINVNRLIRIQTTSVGPHRPTDGAFGRKFDYPIQTWSAWFFTCLFSNLNVQKLINMRPKLRNY